jgi:hypothetical protein
MSRYDAPALASAAVAVHPGRPATGLVHDTNHARVVQLRLDPRSAAR